MEDPTEFDLDVDLLCQLAQQSWMDRGQSMASSGVDMEYAKSELGLNNEFYPAQSRDEQHGETDA